MIDVSSEVAPFASWLAKSGVIVYVVDEYCGIVYPHGLIAQSSCITPLENAYENFSRALAGESFTERQRLAKRFVEVRYSPVEKDEKIVGAVATVVDMTEHEKRVAELAMQDPLTGLPNRRLLNRELAEAQARADRGNQGFALHLIDLDYFKEVNDSYGHPVGDQLLRQVGERLAKAVRSSDLAARLGGDEFAIIQHNVKDPDTCGLLAEKILDSLGRPFDIPNKATQVRVTGSIGIAIYPGDGETVDELVDNADLALYESKRAGRKQFQFFEAELQEAVKKKMRMSREIQTALSESQFYLNFQPIVDLHSERSNLAEVLLRWKHPTKGLISPSEFIPIAEDTGSIIAITYYVIQRLCIHIKQMGDLVQDMAFAINIPGQILKEDFVRRFMCILDSFDISPRQFKLEITEHTALKDTERIQQTMKSLSDLGFDFAIDDFGTGYSSLRTLQTFAFSEVKIDKCFIDNVGTKAGAELVRSIIGIAKSLGLEVVAEGVETPEQLAILRTQGCDCGQGYLFSKPLDVGDFQRYIVNMDVVEEWGDTCIESKGDSKNE